MKKKKKENNINQTIIRGLCIASIPAIATLGFLAYSIVTDFNPLEVESAKVLPTGITHSFINDQIKVTTFNIGYCGLDAKQDFFMDGGDGSRSSSYVQTQKNLKSIFNYLNENQSDAYLLQEVDIKATRSFGINQVETLASGFKNYASTFASNYNVKWVPLPLMKPMGAVESGILTLTKANPEESIRYQLPGDEPIPKRYFDLKRCIMVNHYPLKNGKTLMLINVHLSAFDKGGTIRAQQVKWLNAYLKKEYNPDKNYIIVGGDWNHLMSQEIHDQIKGPVESWIAVLPDSLKEETGFHVVYDKTQNTVRSAETPYKKGKSFETIIDGFLASPNLEVISVETKNLNFEFSDHQPVTAVFKFK